MNRTEHPKIDCVVRVITPENIEFEYMVAGPFQRLPAFILDFVLRISIFMALVFGTLLIGLPLGGSSLILSYAMGLIAFFVLSWMYGAIMEAHFNGRTVGKMMFGLRVMSSDGRPINASQAALRNLLRLCDFMPPLSLTLLSPDAPPVDLIPTCFIGLTAMILTKRMQRVGDLAAGTMVVWEGRRGFHTNLQPEDLRVYSLAELIPPTFQISRTLARAVALYMERRVYLSPQRREEVAGNLAQPLLALFQLKPDTSADLLLCAIYVRIYHSQEHRESQLVAARKQSTSRITNVGSQVELHSGNRLSTARLSASSTSPNSMSSTSISANRMSASSMSVDSTSDDIVTAHVLETPAVTNRDTSLESTDVIVTAEVITAQVIDPLNQPTSVSESQPTAPPRSQS